MATLNKDDMTERKSSIPVPEGETSQLPEEVVEALRKDREHREALTRREGAGKVCTNGPESATTTITDFTKKLLAANLAGNVDVVETNEGVAEIPVNAAPAIPDVNTTNRPLKPEDITDIQAALLKIPKNPLPKMPANPIATPDDDTETSGPETKRAQYCVEADED